MFRRRFTIVLLLLTASRQLTAPAGAADYVIHISVDGLRPDILQTIIDAGQAPNFKRFQDEGAWTNNARTDFSNTETLPNHTSMITGRPVLQPPEMPATVHHGYTENSDPGPAVTLHNTGNLSVPYKASTWDVVHDAGYSTALFASKTKFALYDQSYNATAGAAHPNGRDKIDRFLATSNNQYSMQSQFLTDMAANHYAYAFVHYTELDGVGHSAGWESGEWRGSVMGIDALLGQTFALIQNDSTLSGRTAIVLSADHGGAGTHHEPPSLAVNYTIPFYVWGAGVAHGDLYTLNTSVRTNPETLRPDYDEVGQPIRNGDSGNLALALLGLGPIPGSLINASQSLRVAAPGDFDGDGAANAADLALWRTGFGAASGAATLEGDADGDHGVNGADFLIWQRLWNGGGSSLQIVPEASTLLLAALGLSFCGWLDRRTRQAGQRDC